MAKKKFDGTFAFDKATGELVNYTHSSGDYDMKTRDQARFVGELTYTSYSRGRSSALLVFTDGTSVSPKGWGGTTGSPRPREYSFFMSTADEIIPLMVRGKLKGVFVPSKRGANSAWMLDTAHCMNCLQPQTSHLAEGKCLFGPASFAVTAEK